MNTLFTSIDNSMTRKVPIVSQTSTLSTLAGSTRNFGGDGGAASSALLSNPNGVVCAPNGNLYICDTTNSRIRKINYFTGIISTIAGSSTSSTTGDGGAASSANVANPFNIVCDPFENLFISQGDGKIRLITYSTGIISTIYTGLSQSYSLTYYNGKLYIGNTGTTILQITNTGTLFSTYTTSSISGFSTAIGIAFDSAGSMFVANYGANNIIKCAGGFSGTQSTIITMSGTLPLGLCINANDDLFVSLQTGNVVRKYSKSSSYGSYATVVSSLNGPWNICFGTDYSLYIADAGNDKIKKYTNA